MKISKRRSQMVMSSSDIADVYANWNRGASMKTTKIEDRMQTVVWQYETACAHCMGHLAAGSVAVVVDADTDTESVYHSGCAVELVIADGARRGNLTLVK